jgi:hypothetical protein
MVQKLKAKDITISETSDQVNVKVLFEDNAIEVCPTVCTDPPRAHISNGMLDASFTRFLDHLDHNH